MLARVVLVSALLLLVSPSLWAQDDPSETVLDASWQQIASAVALRARTKSEFQAFQSAAEDELGSLVWSSTRTLFHRPECGGIEVLLARAAQPRLDRVSGWDDPSYSSCGNDYWHYRRDPSDSLRVFVEAPEALFRDAVEAVFQAHSSELQLCYLAQETEEFMLPEGIIHFEVELDSGGLVRRVETPVNTLEGTAAEAIERCARSMIQEWKFPAPLESDLVIRYPVEFERVFH